MAGANYNKLNITSGTDQTLVPALASNTYSVVTVSMVNKSSTQCKVRVALTDTAGSPGAGEYLEYDAILNTGGVLERTGIVVASGKSITVSAAAVTGSLSVAAVAYGIEGVS
jgi:hypothetical protein